MLKGDHLIIFLVLVLSGLSVVTMCSYADLCADEQANELYMGMTQQKALFRVELDNRTHAHFNRELQNAL